MKNKTGVQAQVKSIRAKFRRFVRRFPVQVNVANEAITNHLNLIKLSSQIRAEVEPQLELNREAHDRLFGKKHENQNFVFDLKKYAGTVRVMHNPQGEEREGFDATHVGMNRAENEQRKAAKELV